MYLPHADDAFTAYDSNSNNLASIPTETTDLPRQSRIVFTGSLLPHVSERHGINRYLPLDEGSGHHEISQLSTSIEGTKHRIFVWYAGTPTLDRYKSLNLVDQLSFEISKSIWLQPGDRGTAGRHMAIRAVAIAFTCMTSALTSTTAKW